MELEVRGRNGPRGFELQVHTDDPERVKNALSEHNGARPWTLGRWKKTKNVLKWLFENHAEFYDYIGFDSGNSHGGSGTNFTSNGFRHFIREFFEEDVNYLYYLEDPDSHDLVTGAVMDKLGDVLKEYEEDVDAEYTSRTRLSLEGGKSEDLRDPELVKDSILITEDNAYKFGLKKMEGATSMEEIEEKIRDGMKETYQNQKEAQVNALKNRIETLKSDMEDEKREMLVKGIKMVGDLDDWKVEGDYLVYQNKIRPKWVRKKYEDGNPKRLTEEAREKFYIDGVKVRIRKNISEVGYEDAYHPHALSAGTCTGSWSTGIDRVVDEVVEQLKHVDLHDRSHCDAERDLKQNFDEYTVDESDENQETLGDDENPTEMEIWES